MEISFLMIGHRQLDDWAKPWVKDDWRFPVIEHYIAYVVTRYEF